jgi:hypothetical protein
LRTALNRRGVLAETGLNRPIRVYLPQANAAFSPDGGLFDASRGIFYSSLSSSSTSFADLFFGGRARSRKLGLAFSATL